MSTKNYIKNVGITKTFIKDNNKKYSNEMKWDGIYDGKLAKLNLDVNDNGNKQHVHMELDNKDLIKLLSRESVNVPIDQRLENDFLYNKSNIKLNNKSNKKINKKTLKKNKFIKKIYNKIKQGKKSKKNKIKKK